MDSATFWRRRSLALAEAVCSLAEDSGMPDSFKDTDARMRLARETSLHASTVDPVEQLGNSLARGIIMAGLREAGTLPERSYKALEDALQTLIDRLWPEGQQRADKELTKKEIVGALRTVIDQARADGAARQLVSMVDGGVYLETEALRTIRGQDLPTPSAAWE